MEICQAILRDSIGRLTQLTHSSANPSSNSSFDKTTTTFAYLTGYRQETIERADGNVINQYYYAGFGSPQSNLYRKVKLDINNQNTLVEYSFDELLNARTILLDNPSGNDETHYFSYDLTNGFSMITSETHPQTGTVSYSYYAGSGRLKSKTIPARNTGNVTISYIYDRSGRMVSVSPSNECIDISYNYVSNRPYLNYVEGTDGTNTIFKYTYTYYNNDYLKDKTVKSGTITYANKVIYYYNILGYLTKIDYPSGNYVSYTLNPLGQITSAIYHDALDNKNIDILKSGSTYKAWGVPETFLFGNNINSSFSYNKDRLVIENMDYKLVSNSLVHYKYPSFDNSGYIMNIINQWYHDNHSNSSDWDMTFLYDGLNRLTKTTSKIWSDAINHKDIIINYDDIGNRLLYDFHNQSTSYIYSSNNQLNELRSSGVFRQFFYDKRGNIDEVKGPSASDYLRRFNYDINNQIVEKLNNSSGTIDINYNYDHNGNRIRQIIQTTIPPTDNNFIYDEAGKLLSEMYANGTTSGINGTDYIYIGKLLIGKIQVNH